MLELLADRVGQRGDGAHARRPSPRSARSVRVSRSRSASVRPAARSSARSAAFASRISAAALAEQPRGRLQGGVLRLGRGARQRPRGPLGGGAGLGHRVRGRRHHAKGSWGDGPAHGLGTATRPQTSTKRSRWMTSSAACGSSSRTCVALHPHDPRELARPSSRRCPCRSPRRPPSTSTASPALEAPSTADDPHREQAGAALAQDPRGARRRRRPAPRTASRT